MISRIDHVSLAVNDFKAAKAFFEGILGAVPGAEAKDDSLKFFWKIFSLGDLSRFELMEPTGSGSFLDNFLAGKKGGGIHHMTLETPDIAQFKRHLEDHHIPYFGYADLGDAWKELFIHPRDAFGVLIQVAEMSDPDDYLGEGAKHGTGKRWRIERVNGGIELVMAHPGGGNVRFEMDRDEVGALVEELTAFIS
ncbi:MAG: VOC family protein [Desulfobacterales bacterium]